VFLYEKEICFIDSYYFIECMKEIEK
jgi:hypothetical protein